MGEVQQTSDAIVQDRHANTVLVHWDLAVEEGVVQYTLRLLAHTHALRPASSPVLPLS